MEKSRFSSWLSPFWRRVSSFFIQTFWRFLSNSVMLSLPSFVYWSSSMMVNFPSVLKSWSLCAKCRSARIAFNFRINCIPLSIWCITLAGHVMVNSISTFVLVTLKLRRNYLSATESSVVWWAWRAVSSQFSYSEGLSFYFVEFYFVTTCDAL